MKWLVAVVLILVALATLVAARCVVFVDEAEFVIITQFGRPVATVREAGLRVKPPWQSAIRIDRRVQVYDPLPSEFLAGEKKTVNLDLFACWKVAEPRRFLETVGSPQGAEARLHDMVWSELRAEVGRQPFDALVSTDPAKHRLDTLVESITRRCAQRAGKNYGIQLVDVRLKRITPPTQARQSVFSRMRSERATVARQLRAQGEQKALETRADADRQRTEILAEAYREAETLRGQAEAEAARIYAKAHARDPEFYELLRTLEAYRAFLDEKTTLLLSSDSDLLKYLTRTPKVNDQKPPEPKP